MANDVAKGVLQWLRGLLLGKAQHYLADYVGATGEAVPDGAFLLNFNGGRPEPGHFRFTGRTYDPWCYENLLGLGVMWAAADSEIDWWEYDVVWNLQD